MRRLPWQLCVCVCVCVFFALVVVTIGAVGIIGVRSTTHVGNSVTDDEVLTAITTAQVGRNMDAAYAAGEEAALTVDAGERSQCL